LIYCQFKIFLRQTDKYAATSDCYYRMNLHLIIPNSVTVIESMAFLNSKKLSNISFGSSIEKIEYGAFWDCSNLSEITLPKSLNTLGDRVFDNCS